MGQITANAYAWALFRVAGGFRNPVFYAIAYLAGGIALVGMSIAINPRNTHAIMSATASIALGLQIAVFGLFASLAIVNSIQRDLTSKMIESHRLMPVPPHLAVLGYIAGNAFAVMPIFLVNLVVGGTAASAAGLPMTWWLIANAVILGFCCMLWCVAAAGAMTSTLMGIGGMAPFFITLLSGGMAATAMPGLLLFCSPVMGVRVFSAQSYDGDLVLPLVIAALFQAAMGAVLVAGAARRFRSSDLPCFPGLRGGLLALVFTLASITAMHLPGVFPRFSEMDPSVVCVASIGGLLILSILVISATVADNLLDRHRDLSGAGQVRREMLTLGALVACVLFLAGFAPSELERLPRLVPTVLVCMLFLSSVYLWIRWLYRSYPSVVTIIALVSVQCVVPPVIGLFFQDSRLELTPTGRFLCQLSPFAAIGAIWAQKMTFFWSSLLVHAALLLVPAVLLLVRKPAAAASAA